MQTKQDFLTTVGHVACRAKSIKVTWHLMIQVPVSMLDLVDAAKVTIARFFIFHFPASVMSCVSSMVTVAMTSALLDVLRGIVSYSTFYKQHYFEIVSSPDTLVGTVIPYIQLGVTEGVATHTVPESDDGTSSPIYVSFPLGSQLQSTIYVRLF